MTLPFAGTAVSHAEAVLVELRRELLREARYLLSRWERSGCSEDRGRLLQVLDDLALLVRSQARCAPGRSA